jgi:transposase-like protein
MKKYRQYGEDFKRALVAQIESGAMSLSGASREHNISATLIDRWRRQIRENTLTGRPNAREKHLEKELDRYKKKVGELALEVDFLKKINEYSASLRKSDGLIVTGGNTAQEKRGAK